MKKNMGSLDKMIRVIVATVILVLYFTKIITGTLAIVLLSRLRGYLRIHLCSFLLRIPASLMCTNKYPLPPPSGSIIVGSKLALKICPTSDQLGGTRIGKLSRRD